MGEAGVVKEKRGRMAIVAGWRWQIAAIGDNMSGTEGRMLVELSVSWVEMAGVCYIGGLVADRPPDAQVPVESSRSGTDKSLHFVDSFFTSEPSSSAVAVGIVFFIVMFFMNWPEQFADRAPSPLGKMFSFLRGSAA